MFQVLRAAICIPPASLTKRRTDHSFLLRWVSHAPNVIFAVLKQFKKYRRGAELLGEEQVELPRNLSGRGKSRFMSPCTLRATGQPYRGDFHTVSLHHAGTVVAFCAFIPMNTDVLPSFPSLHFKKRKKKSVPVGEMFSQRKLPSAGLCLPAGGTWSRIGALELCVCFSPAEGA